MTNYTDAETKAMKPKDLRSLIRKGEFTSLTVEACQGYAQANLAIVPRELAFEFLLFCNRNPRPCPILEVTEPGDPEPEQLAPGADLRTDLPKYRIFKNGELIDEPTEITKYWRDDLVSFVIGCSRTFVWAFRAANIRVGRYGGYKSTIPCVPAGRLHGPMCVSVRKFYNTHDAIRAIQISSRHLPNHGVPVHIGDPAEIGINVAQPDPFFPNRLLTDPPKPGEIFMAWGEGVTPQTVAVESKVPFMIAHCPGHMFVTDRLVEELAIL